MHSTLIRPPIPGVFGRADSRGIRPGGRSEATLVLGGY